MRKRPDLNLNAVKLGDKERAKIIKAAAHITKVAKYKPTQPYDSGQASVIAGGAVQIMETVFPAVRGLRRSAADEPNEETAKSRNASALGLLMGTLGSIRDYTTDDLRVRIRWAVAVLRGNEQEIRKAASADFEMQQNFDEDGNRIPNESAVSVIAKQ